MVINMLKTWWKARKIMKAPKIKWYFSKGPWYVLFHTPSNPIISWESRDVWWKDKYDVPRFEYSPMMSLILFGHFQIAIEFDISDDFDEYQYWEQLLWMLYYIPGNQDPERTLSEEDWIAGRETWPWVKADDGKSSWSEEFHV